MTYLFSKASLAEHFTKNEHKRNDKPICFEILLVFVFHLLDCCPLLKIEVLPYLLCLLTYSCASNCVAARLKSHHKFRKFPFQNIKMEIHNFYYKNEISFENSIRNFH